MGSFRSFEHQKRVLSTASPSSFARHVRPFAPVPVPVLQPLSLDMEAHLEHTRSSGYSLDQMDIFPPERNTSTCSQQTDHTVQQKHAVQDLPPASMDSIDAELAQAEKRPRLGWNFANIPLFPDPVATQVVQRRERDEAWEQNTFSKINMTGLPDTLKAGVETLSGLSLDDVHVHYNSSQPVEVQALAYTQGTEIHIGPGQEQHLAHEAWHVVQQKQGRVMPTIRLQGTPINDNARLEREADDIGKEVASFSESQNPVSNDVMPKSTASAHNVIQRVRTKKREKKLRVEMKGKKSKKTEEEEIVIDEATLALIDDAQNAALAQIAEAIHKTAGGNPNTNTTGVAELKNGTLVVATQLSPTNKALRYVAELFGIKPEHIYKTLGAGYHVETTLYIKFAKLVGLRAVGASQGFCPDCQEFLEAKDIEKDGEDRTTMDTTWHSPEYYDDEEKQPITAPYPYTRQKDARVSNEVIRYTTQAEYTIVQEAQTLAKRKNKDIAAKELLKVYRTNKPLLTTGQELLTAYNKDYLATQKAFFG
jgi:Domain of unknown function (DUF4157)